MYGWPGLVTRSSVTAGTAGTSGTAGTAGVMMTVSVQASLGTHGTGSPPPPVALAGAAMSPRLTTVRAAMVRPSERVDMWNMM